MGVIRDMEWVMAIASVRQSMCDVWNGDDTDLKKQMHLKTRERKKIAKKERERS